MTTKLPDDDILADVAVLTKYIPDVPRQPQERDQLKAARIGELGSDLDFARGPYIAGANGIPSCRSGAAGLVTVEGNAGVNGGRGGTSVQNHAGEDDGDVGGARGSARDGIKVE